MSRVNPRRVNWRAREEVLLLVRRRVLAGETCGICGQPIDLDAQQWYVDPADGKRKRAPWSLECDEIVPVALGGSPYDPGNVQPAHRICNQRKGCCARPARASAPVVGATSREW